jgi:hypothetical protein
MKEWLQHLWIWEVWKENRSIFKILFADTMFFLFLMATLKIGHHLIEWTALTQERREIAETLHFSFTMTVWGLFFIVLVLEIVASKFES